LHEKLKNMFCIISICIWWRWHLECDYCE